MAWPEKQRSGRYAGKYRADGEVRSVGTFTSKAAARRAAAAEEDKARTDPTRVDPRDGKVTWAVWLPQWQQRRRIEPGTEIREPSRINRTLERWGKTPLVSIRREDVQAWVNELEDSGLSAWSVHHHYRLLSSSLKDAVTERRITATPCVGIRLPPIVQGDRRFLSHTEFDRVAATMDGKYHVLVNLLIGAGLRWAEAAGLHLHRLDLAREELEVVEVYDDKTREIRPYPKNKQRRTLVLPDWLVPILREHVDSFPLGSDCGAAHRHSARCRSGLLIPSRTYGPVSYSGFRTRHWGKAVGRPMWRLPDGREYATPSEAAKRKGGKEAARVWRDGLARVGEVRIHDLRHSFAAWNLQGEHALSLYELSLAMGHQSVRVTEQYAHLMDTARPRYKAAMAWPTTDEDEPPAGPPLRLGG